MASAKVAMPAETANAVDRLKVSETNRSPAAEAEGEVEEHRQGADGMASLGIGSIVDNERGQRRKRNDWATARIAAPT